jgi:CelD/BcsL family acetyltransferase involved in cellulose biosynthesis
MLRFRPKAVAPAHSGMLTVQTIDDIAGLADIEAAWRALDATSSSPIFFQSFAWCSFIWRTRLRATKTSTIAPKVVVIRRGASIVAIWPLAVTSGLTGRYAHDLSEPFGQYSECLIAPGIDPAAVGDVALAELRRWAIDGLILRRVRDDAALRPWLEKVARTIGSSEAAPAVELSAFDGFDAYRRSLNSKTLKNLRNYRNRLSRLGALHHEVIDEQTARSEAMAHCFAGRTDWLQASGLTSTAFADPAFTHVVAGLAAGTDGAPEVMVMSLSLASAEAEGCSADVSVQWGFVQNKRYYAFMSARNPIYDAYSPGRLHLEDVVAACAKRGLETVDLLVPAMPYKLGVSTTSVSVDGFAIALSVRGQLFVNGWHGAVRPVMKSTMLALPASVRRWAFDPAQAMADLLRPPAVPKSR